MDIERHREDKDLIESFLREGDESALRLLFDRHLKALCGFLSRFVGSSNEADDLAQEALIRAWRNLHSFKSDRNFRTWLLSIARNLAIDWLRKKKSLPFSAFEDESGTNALADGLDDGADPADVLIDRADAAEVLRAALAELPPVYREVLALYNEGEMNFREISEASGVPLNTVKSRYRRALALLRVKLERDPERTRKLQIHV